MLDRTHRAEKAIGASAVVVGYRPYLELIEDLTAGKELISSGMRKETERCREALKRAAAGATVALVSSGDPGVYGMAGLAVELARRRRASTSPSRSSRGSRPPAPRPRGWAPR